MNAAATPPNDVRPLRSLPKPVGAIWHILLWSAWGFLLISLPFTTFPFVARSLGGGQASPLAGVPLLILVVVWLAPDLLRGGKLPSVSKPLFFLALIAAVTGGASVFLQIYPAFGQHVPDRVVRGLVTLAVGLCFYLVAAKFPRSDRALRISLILLYVGAVLMLLWASVQGYLLIQGVPEVPDRLNRLHRLWSMRDMSPQRVTGFAFEPSWLADQLVILYLPLWLASVIRGFSAFTSRETRWSVELILLVWGMGIFFLTFSRIGYIALFAVLGAIGLVVSWRLAGRIAARRDTRSSNPRPRSFRLRQAFLWAGMVLLLIALMTALIYAAGLVDKRIARLFTYDYVRLFTGGEESVYSFANRLAYAERVIYWAVGYRTFALHPVLGVGLGDIGFFYRQVLPTFGYGLVEMIWLLEGKLDLPNAKNIWVRLLAETGLMGFLAYSLWLLLIGLAARVLTAARRGILPVLGLAGMMAVLAQVFEGFSLDSFALPELWIVTGLVTAAFLLEERERLQAAQAGALAGAPEAAKAAPAPPRTDAVAASAADVAVVIPCYNERQTLLPLLESIYQQTCGPERMQVVIADGMSTDGSRQVAEAYARDHPRLRLKVIDNPSRRIPAALNQAIEATGGKLVIRLDAHSVPGKDYVERCLATSDATRAANVGGVWEIKPPVDRWMARGIAAAAGHPLGAGDARYRTGGASGEVDTVPFGAFRREWLEKVGPFNEALRTNEDYEYNVRLRRAGGTIWFDPAIRSVYFARGDLKALARQYARYGLWKARMALGYPGSLRWRQVLPPLLVVSLAATAVLALFSPSFRTLLAAEVGLYAGLLLVAGVIEAIRRGDSGLAASLPLAVATMHLCWGSAFLAGLFPYRTETRGE